MKLKSIKQKTKAKTAKANSKTKNRVRKAVAKTACALALFLAVTGCVHPGEQAAKAETLNVTIRDSVIAVNVGAKKATASCTSNTVELAESEKTYDITILSQAQSLESSGSETFGQTQTPTVSTPVSVDARYNDALAAASSTSKGVLESLMDGGAKAVLGLMASGNSGSVEVKKKDGTKTVVDCRDGQCSFRGGSDCSSCSDGQCAPGCAK